MNFSQKFYVMKIHLPLCPCLASVWDVLTTVALTNSNGALSKRNSSQVPSFLFLLRLRFSGTQLTDKFARSRDNEVRGCGIGCLYAPLKISENFDAFWTIPCSVLGGELVQSYGAALRFDLEFNGRVHNK